MGFFSDFGSSILDFDDEVKKRFIPEEIQNVLPGIREINHASVKGFNNTALPLLEKLPSELTPGLENLEDEEFVLGLGAVIAALVGGGIALSGSGTAPAGGAAAGTTGTTGAGAAGVGAAEAGAGVAGATTAGTTAAPTIVGTGVTSTGEAGVILSTGEVVAADSAAAAAAGGGGSAAVGSSAGGGVILADGTTATGIASVPTASGEAGVLLSNGAVVSATSPAGQAAISGAGGGIGGGLGVAGGGGTGGGGGSFFNRFFGGGDSGITLSGTGDAGVGAEASNITINEGAKQAGRSFGEQVALSAVPGLIAGGAQLGGGLAQASANKRALKEAREEREKDRQFQSSEAQKTRDAAERRFQAELALRQAASGRGAAAEQRQALGQLAQLIVQRAQDERLQSERQQAAANAASAGIASALRQ